MKNLIILLSSAMLVMCNSCRKVVGEGPLIIETRSTGNFSSIETDISGDVYYVQDSVYKIELTAQQNILNVIETPIINNKLVVRFKNDVTVRSHEQITIRITAPAISGIAASGSGTVTVLSPLSGDNFSFSLTGSGTMTLPEINCTSVAVTSTGSGSISIGGGSTSAETLKITGSGNIDAQNVLTKTAVTNTSGSGNIWLNASEQLNITISGSGSVYYSGNPIVTTNISGSGHVTHQ